MFLLVAQKTEMVLKKMKNMTFCLLGYYWSSMLLVFNLLNYGRVDYFLVKLIRNFHPK